jgi:hypothetical protein
MKRLLPLAPAGAACRRYASGDDYRRFPHVTGIWLTARCQTGRSSYETRTQVTADFLLGLIAGRRADVFDGLLAACRFAQCLDDDAIAFRPTCSLRKEALNFTLSCSVSL